MEFPDWFFHLEWQHRQSNLSTQAEDQRQLREALGESTPSPRAWARSHLAGLVVTTLLGALLLWQVLAWIPWRFV